MQDLQIQIRYKCEKCGGDGAARQGVAIVGNCSKCSGSGIHEEWVGFKGLDLIEKKVVNAGQESGQEDS